MICVSIVSHGHSSMVSRLVDQVLTFPEVQKIIVTMNISEDTFFVSNPRLSVFRNSSAKGFGANHNAAFAVCVQPFFCVLNPDVVLPKNPFGALLACLTDDHSGVVAPLVISSDGAIEDSMRVFITPCTMLKRVLGIDLGSYALIPGAAYLMPDWVAGMFMLFRSEAYETVGGFDERYFMYCEDADICTRLWKIGHKVIGCLSIAVIHDAQRASHRSLKHLSWHLQSLSRYLLSHMFSLPKKEFASNS